MPDDHFSPIALNYKKGRIAYPKSLYPYLRSLCQSSELAWDCATGTGQAAMDLSKEFNQVIATDMSDSLLSHADKCHNIEYRVAPAEHSELSYSSVDLITVAQAIHWFELSEFWNEVSRVSKPGGVLAYWGYLWPVVNTSIDNVFKEFQSLIDSYWPEKCRLLHKKYADIHPPFQVLDSPEFLIQESWTVDEYLRHLHSWSSTRYFKESNHADPVLHVQDRLKHLWGDETRRVEWSLILKVFRCR